MGTYSYPTARSNNYVIQNVTNSTGTSIHHHHYCPPPPPISHLSRASPARIPLPTEYGPLFNEPCLACGSQNCGLTSHKKYGDALRARDVNREMIKIETFPSRLPLPTEITNPRIDPFARYPIDMTSEEHEIFDMWGQPWGTDLNHGPERHLFPYRQMDKFLPYAMKSSLVMRVALNLITTHTLLPRGKLDEKVFVQQTKVFEGHLKANQNPEQVNSDENLLAAMVLLSNYQSHGEVDSAFEIMQGIYRMVKDRGGLHHLGMNGHVAAYVSLADHVYAIFLCRQPVFELPLPSLQIPGVVPRQGGGFTKLFAGKKLGSEHLTAALDLSRTFVVWEDGYLGLIPHRLLESFQYLQIVSEYQLARIHAILQPEQIRERCICMALLILDHVVIRNLGYKAPVVSLLETRFWTTFHQGESQAYWENEDVCLTMWLLISPLVVSLREPCQHFAYIVEKLKVLRLKADIQTWMEFEHRVLKPYLWCRTAQGDMLHDLWKRIS